jgi:hypothetical protein
VGHEVRAFSVVVVVVASCPHGSRPAWHLSPFGQSAFVPLGQFVPHLPFASSKSLPQRIVERQILDKSFSEKDDVDEHTASG